ncbi:PoNe immunity protein domain-containing protein [Burkholderia lata]|uniref:PoNe immunity protein domain-containing protein n=1 Tax=Burkholderia lata (strain ATCC 17760 / DSM 23089 / LMG 22485 / NCIMB 9086 / R18194 / 383) TaxID=482957 RepID=UPI0020C5EC2E|nr:PoNe immunity protein domain-containing protein [Burkholderia lata]
MENLQFGSTQKLLDIDMTRDSLAPRYYWDKWIEYSHNRIADMQTRCKEPSANPGYRPQYVFEMALNHLELILNRYSRGDSVSVLSQHLPGLLDAWEESVMLGESVFTDEQKALRRSWARNLDFYIISFWLVGLALTLEIPEDQWRRLIALIGNEGEDVLLDRVIASRDHNRKIGTELRHPKPYRRLLDAVDAPAAGQAKQLRLFVENWYRELDRPPKKGGVPAVYDKPYWYGFDEYIEGGAYFGFWCVEAAAAVKAFSLDDSQCRGGESLSVGSCSS